MPDISLSRHRPLALLAGVVLAQVLLLAFQIKRDHDVRLIRYWAAAIVMPFERGGTWTFDRTGGIWSGYIALRGTHAENARLHDELAALQIRNRELESQAAEAQRLGALLNFRESHPEAPMLAAQVIGASADTSSHTVSINRGERDRVHRNMAVITPNGIVGKIVEVFPTTAQVLLIIDKDSGVGSLLADTRTHGVVKGSGDPEPRLDYVVNDEKVHVGELVLTSGEDRIFPKGLLVGSIIGAAPGNPFQIIHVQAAARLDRLEDVLILLSLQDLNPKTTEESTEGGAAQPDAPGIVVPPQAALPQSPAQVDANAAKVSAPSPSTKTPAPAAAEH